MAKEIDVTQEVKWLALGALCGLYLLITGRVRDWSLLPVFVGLGPLVVLFYLFALVDAAIRKGEA